MNKILLSFCLIGFFCITGAQQLTAQQSDSLRHAILPGAGYDSDAGLAVSALYQMVRYNKDIQPYRRLFRLQGAATLKANFYMKTELENRTASGGRFHAELTAERINNAYFFGMGPESEFDKSLWDNGYYDYSRWYFILRIERGISLLRDNGLSRMEWIYGSQTDYMNTDLPENSYIAAIPPLQAGGAFFNKFHTGILLDYRDSVFRPSSGYRFYGSGSIAPGLLLNERTTGSLEAVFSYYTSFRVIQEIVFASRIGMDQTIGRAPYFVRPVIGGPDDVRGYPYERFRDYGRLYHNLELRTWLIKLPFWSIEWGGQLFWDGGWVYEHPLDINIRNTYKWTAGFGGVSTFLNPDFIIRADVGFSDEIWRLTLGIGYLF